MCECPKCGEKVNKEDVEFDCPFCGQTDYGEGFYTCKNCETLFDYAEELWECKFCHNKPYGGGYSATWPECGESLGEYNYCFNCGWSNNQGWIGEHYG